MNQRYSHVFKARAVRMVLDQCGESPYRRKGINTVAKRLGCLPTSLWAWILQAERDLGLWPEAGMAGKERKPLLDIRSIRDLRPRVVIAVSKRRSRGSNRPDGETENP